MFSNVSDEIQNIINNIQDLQNLEQNIINNYKISSNSDNKTSLVEEINAVVKIRITMYQHLLFLYNSVVTNTSVLNNHQHKQLELIKKMEDKLNALKENQPENNKQVRLIQINKYYIEKFQAYISIFKVVIKLTCCILIFIILNRMKFVPNEVFNYFIGFICLYWSYYLIPMLYDIFRRDNMNYNEFSSNYIPKV